jgi:Small-conductance mechanosensitive channel
MDNNLPLEKFLAILQQANVWVERYILTQDFLINLTILAFTLGLIHFIIWYYRGFFKQSLQQKLLGTRFSSFAPHVKEITFLASFTLCAWLLTSVITLTPIDESVLYFTRNIITAWLFMRIAIIFVQHSFLLVITVTIVGIVFFLDLITVLDDTIAFLQKMQFKFINSYISFYQLLSTVVVVAISFYILNTIKERINIHLKKSDLVDPAQKILIYKLCNIAAWIIIAFIGLASLGFNITTLAVFSGAVGLGIGLGLQAVILNILSGFFLLMDRSIKPGDVIAIGDTFGWVNSLKSRYISIITRDGKEHLIPNEKFITNPVENWSYSSRSVRIKLPVTVSYNSDLDQVTGLMEQSIEGLDRVLTVPSPTCLIKEFGDHGVAMELRVWIQDPDNGVSNLKSAIYFNIWRKFKEHHIEIPYPQLDLYIKNKMSLDP